MLLSAVEGNTIGVHASCVLIQKIHLTNTTTGFCIIFGTFILSLYWTGNKINKVCIKTLTAWLKPPSLLSVWGRGICWRGWWCCCCWFLEDDVEALDSEEDCWGSDLGSEVCFWAGGLAWTFLTSWLWGRGPKIWPTWKYGYRRAWTVRGQEYR